MKQLFTILLFIPLTSFCQVPKPTSPKKVAIGFSFSPDYDYRTLKGEGSVDIVIANRNKNEAPKFGYTTGFKLTTDIDKYFAFEVGLLFSDKGEKTTNTDLIWPSPDPNLPTKSAFIYHYYYLDIPLKLSCYFYKTKKGGFFLSAGLLPSIFLKQKTVSKLEYSDGQKTTSKSSSNNLTKFNFAYTLGAGYQTDIKDKILLKIEPTYRHSITSVKDGPVKEYLYSVGLELGLYLRLK